MTTEKLKIVYRDPAKLKGYERNTRTHSPEQVRAIRRSIDEFGPTNPILLKDDAETIGAGHARQMACLLDPPLKSFPTIVLNGLTEDQWRAYVIADNRLAENGSGWDQEALELELRHLSEAQFDLSLLGFDDADLESLIGDGGPPTDPEPEPLRVSLADRFGVVPFSVLNAREGWWQDRKRAWLALGIKSEVGRGENLIQRSLHERIALISPAKSGTSYPATVAFIAACRGEGLDDAAILARAEADPEAIAAALKGKGGKKANARTFGQDLMKGEHKVGQTANLKGGTTLNLTTDPYRKPGEEVPASGAGTSIFDPVLCELNYRWFCPPGGMILDPFAGGSVRGIVASKLGYGYYGLELRGEQVRANREQAEALCAADPQPPKWIEGDSAVTLANLTTSGLTGMGAADFVFSCPPYADLEVYSEDPADLSTMDYGAFLDAYDAIIAGACERLRPDRFAAFVVGDIRDKAGNYRNFVSDTIAAFRKAGLNLYNEAILVTAAGSLPIRAGKQFASTRKLGKTHQNVLIFVKGDGRRATEACGVVEFGDIPEDDQGGVEPPLDTPEETV